MMLHGYRVRICDVFSQASQFNSKFVASTGCISIVYLSKGTRSHANESTEVECLTISTVFNACCTVTVWTAQWQPLSLTLILSQSIHGSIVSVVISRSLVYIDFYMLWIKLMSSIIIHLSLSSGSCLLFVAYSLTYISCFSFYNHACLFSKLYHALSREEGSCNENR